MINVMIVDDHALFRHGIRRILETTPDIKVVGEAADGCDFLERLPDIKTLNILLMDISMPIINGIDVVKQIRSERPELPIVILSMYEEEQYITRAIKLGCRGYIPKSGSPEELIKAIYTVAKGERYIPPKIAEKFAEFLARGKSENLHELLSGREFDIMIMLASGKSISEIAELCRLNIKTVSTYKMRICKKLNCKNNAEITRYVIENKLFR